MERFPDPGSSLEDAGVPDLQDPSAAQRLSGDTHEAIDLTHDRALASESWGTTASEQRAGEPLDLRLAHEEPDVDTGHQLDPNRDAAGRLVEPDEGARGDTDAEAVAQAVGNDGGGLTAEESAMHLVDEPGAER